MAAFLSRRVGGTCCLFWQICCCSSCRWKFMGKSHLDCENRRLSEGTGISWVKNSQLIPSSRGYTAALSIHIPLSAHVFHGAITQPWTPVICLPAGANHNIPQLTWAAGTAAVLQSDIHYLRGFSSRRTPLSEITTICQCCMKLHQMILIEKRSIINSHQVWQHSWASSECEICGDLLQQW